MVIAKDYQQVPASTTAQLKGQQGVGTLGDILETILITPLTTSPGEVTVQDGSGAIVEIFAGGAGSVSDLKPFYATFGAKSVTGPWELTTGANVKVTVFGRFN